MITKKKYKEMLEITFPNTVKQYWFLKIKDELINNLFDNQFKLETKNDKLLIIQLINNLNTNER